MRNKIIYIGILTVIFLLLTLNGFGKVAKVTEPSPEIVDRIIHDKGNIVLTVDNYGYMGNYSYYGYPSGEWPKNSGQDYIGEMKYWFGTVTPGGDTIVIDTYEDAEPLPSLISGTDSYDIRLSTDTTRYNYDPTDTIGQGLGNPAYGWRVYDPDSADWVYNRVYSVGDETFYPGGPTAEQQSFYRFADADGSRSLGLELSQTIYQWNYCYNEDICFVVLTITNNSGVDYPNFHFAVYSDFDVGGPNSEGENGRLGDLVASDSTENLAWTYDEDGYDLGWGPLVRTGIMGTKYLETPDGIGMTAFRTGQWETVSEADDAQRYELIGSDQYDESLPPTDQYYLQCTSGINLTDGKTIRVVFAIIAGQDLEEFYDNATTAQTLYDNYFVGPQPPATPTLTVLEGDGKNYLSWNDTAEVDIDPLSGVADFRGYKLYRSTNKGYTWGFKSTSNTNSCLDVDYVPITAFQVDTPGDPIPHTHIDDDLTNGIEYWYCLVAYDAGDTTVPIDPLQNGFGTPTSDANVVRAVPRTDPAGSYPAQSTVEHTTLNDAELSDGEVYAITFDQGLVEGEEYSVVFSETEAQTYWHVIDNISGDTVLADQTIQEGDAGLYEVVEGIRVVVRNGDRVPRSMAQTSFATGDTTLNMGIFYGAMGDAAGAPRGSDKHFRSTYEIRFTSGGSQGYWWWDDVTPVSLPFEVWNTTLGYQVIAEILDYGADGSWDYDQGDLICIVNIAYDGNAHPEGYPYSHAWIFGLEGVGSGYSNGDVFTIEGAPVNGADDVYTFRVDGIDETAASAALNNIRVVPNPYLGHATWETSRYDRKLQFTHLPDICTVRIYTLSGDLVKIIEHADGTGTADWNLLSDDGLTVAPGIFLFHVDSEYGSHIGRFAVIK